MAKFVYATAEDAGYNPCLVCNMLDRKTQVRLTDASDLLGFDSSSAVVNMTVDGMEVKGIPLVFPEIEVTQYVLNGRAWQTALADGDVHFAVAGTNQCCFPLAREDKRFGSWTATLLWDDRVDRLGSAPRIERIRDRLSRPFLEQIEKRAYRSADPVMVLSEYTARGLSDRYGIERECIEVVPYPIDTDRFSPEPAGVQPDQDGPIVLFVGRLNDPRKNTELLIEAFSLVRRNVPNAELWLLGSEPDERLNRAAERFGDEGAISFFDQIPNENLPGYYRAADVFAIPSNQEGLAIVGLEAMACGTPVVSTRCGGPEQYVEDGETGYLVGLDDTEEFAERIEELLTNPDRRRHMGRVSRKRIEDEYARTWIRERFVRAFETLRFEIT